MSEGLPITYSERGRRHPAAAALVARLGFPVLICAAMGALISAIKAGVDPLVAMPVCILSAYAVLAVGERLLPFRDSWLHSQNDLRTDIAWFASNGLINRLLEPVLLAAATAGGAWLAATVGTGLWPTHWPLLGQLALGLLVAEFFEYWFHRSMHEVDALWRFHATHHSAPRLYWLNAVRFHVVDYVLVGIIKLVPLALLGAGVEVFAMVNCFAAVHGAYQHANIPVKLGPLNWLFSMTELHRWHHSPKISDANHNYGGTLILWDIVFGTRFLPADEASPEHIGMESLPDFPMGFWQQLFSPLRWARVVESSGGGKQR